MVKIVNGDLIKSSANYICHQVNCQGVMGSGVAKQIRSKWPIVYDSYKEFCRSDDSKNLLGKVQGVKIDNDLTIVNIFGQYTYGRDGHQYTDITVLEDAFKYLSNKISLYDRIAMPYRIGCGLGGGNWGLIIDIITDLFSNHDLTLFKYNK